MAQNNKPGNAKADNVQEYDEHSAKYLDAINEQVKTCLGKDTRRADYEEITKETKEVGRVKPIDFAATLGSAIDPDNLWWRLYINPRDWDLAWELLPRNPGLYYDSRNVGDANGQPGFQQAMIAAYKEYLSKDIIVSNKRVVLNNSLGGLVHNSPFGYEDYEKLWQVCIPGTLSGRESKFESRHKMGKNSSLSSPCPLKLADDVRGDKIKVELEGGKIKEWDLVDGSEEASSITYYSRHGGQAQLNMNTNLSEDDMKGIVDEYFRDYRRSFTQTVPETHTAPGTHTVPKKPLVRMLTSKDRLLAIAKLVRRLHMTHVFSDGNGRTNVFLLLPALLLYNGIGLPFGGKNDAALKQPLPQWKVTRATLSGLFNGGYTLEQIADFLWVAQDLGKAAARGETAIPSASASSSSSSSSTSTTTSTAHTPPSPRVPGNTPSNAHNADMKASSDGRVTFKAML